MWEPLEDPERRSTRYSRFIDEVKAKAREQRNQKLENLKQSYDNQKAMFFEKRASEFQKIYDDIKSLQIDNVSLDRLESLTKEAIK